MVKPSGLSDGAQLSTTPVVGWAQVTTGRPPAGASPSGTTMKPDTAMSCPLTLVEW